MFARRLLFFASVGLLMSLFNNCGESFVAVDPSKGVLNFSSSGDVCLDQLESVYATTYFPFLKATCNQCHSNAHGSTDVNVSFAAFMTYGSTLIDHQATTAHGGNSLGPQYQPQIDAFKPTWTAGNNAYLACKANSSGGSNSSVADIPLVGKTATNLQATLTNGTLWVPVTWNTASDVVNNAQMNAIKGTLRVEVRILTNGTMAAGLVFRNPSFTPASGQAAFVIGGLSVAINGVDQSQFFTTYKTLGSLGTGVAIPAGVAASPTVALATGYGSAPIVFDGVNATTTMGMIMKNVVVGGTIPGGGGGGATPTPTPTPTPAGATVTFTQLTAAGGVFANSCVGCHNAGNMAGGLNLTNYTAAKALASTIAARVTSAAAPMPPSGLLPAAQQATITSWVNGGAPQ